jgi:hypothetical protein
MIQDALKHEDLFAPEMAGQINEMLWQEWQKY